MTTRQQQPNTLGNWGADTRNFLDAWSAECEPISTPLRRKQLIPMTTKTRTTLATATVPQKLFRSNIRNAYFPATIGEMLTAISDFLDKGDTWGADCVRELLPVTFRAWEEIKELPDSTKGELFSELTEEGTCFDYALPQEWLDAVAKSAIYDVDDIYHMIRCTTVIVYPKEGNSQPLSCCREVNELIEGFNKNERN